MKKIVLLMFAVSFYSFSDSMESFLEYNLKPDFTFSSGEKIEKNSVDLSLNFEFYSPPQGNRLGGFGITQNSVTIKNFSSNKFNIGTYYLVNRFNLTRGKIQPYFKLQGGAYYPSTIFGKTEITTPQKISLDSGLFYGAAVGVQIKGFLIQALYKNYLGKSRIDEVVENFDYNTVTISIGYNLKI